MDMNVGTEFAEKMCRGAFNGFLILGIIHALMFVLVFGMIIFVIAKMIGQTRKDDRSPRIKVPATIVAKRSHMSGRHYSYATHGTHHSHTTYYYVTFQMDTGDRMELHVPRNEVGLLVEGDRGMLTFQGSRYLNFERY